MSRRQPVSAGNIELPPGDLLCTRFFERPADDVASELVGKILWRTGYGGGRLTEVEAYLPVGDPASHAALGKTRRNGVMFGPAGRLYVFLCYGVHYLLNLVCDGEGVGAAVLVRSFEPTASLEVGKPTSGARGPGMVGRALGVGLHMNGWALGRESGVFVVDDGERPSVARTARVGISRGERLPLRFCRVGSTYVSGPTRSIEER